MNRVHRVRRNAVTPLALSLSRDCFTGLREVNGQCGVEPGKYQSIFLGERDQRGQPVGVQKISHPSFSIDATSSELILTPSLRARGIPCRLLAARFRGADDFRTSIFKGAFTGKSTGSSGTITLPSKCARRVTAHDHTPPSSGPQAHRPAL